MTEFVNRIALRQSGKIFRALLELDWSKAPNVLVLAFLFVLSRIPLLNLGFGLDPDAWRIANSAYDLRYSHSYHASRFPGYPLPEYLNSLIIDHGWLATNSLTMVLSLISVVSFARILKNLNAQYKGLLTLTYAFLPILWINSTNTMDYTWALTFITIAWFLVLRKRPAIAGLAMGLATGSRISSAILALPFLFLIWIENRKIKDAIYFCMTMALTSLFLFLPLFLRYGLRFLTYYRGTASIFRIGYEAIKHFGILAVLWGVTVFFMSLRPLSGEIIRRDKNTLFLLSAILLMGILFLRVPYEIEYVIPMIPFGLVLLNRVSKRELMVIFCALLVSNSALSPGIGQAIGDGAIRGNMEARKEQVKFVQHLMAAKVEDHSVVIIGLWLPALSYLNENVSCMKNQKMMGDANSPQKGVWNFEKDIWYRYSVPLDELQELQGRGYTIYYIEGMRDYIKRVHGYDLDDYDCVYLNSSFAEAKCRRCRASLRHVGGIGIPKVVW